MRRYLPWAAGAAAVAVGGALLFRPQPVAAGRAQQGRVGVLSGDLLVRGPGDTDWSYADRNGVVSDGDTLWCDEKSTAEIQLERGAWLRLGPDTRVEVRRLPPEGDFRLRRGSLYVDLSTDAPSRRSYICCSFWHGSAVRAATSWIGQLQWRIASPPSGS